MLNVGGLANPDVLLVRRAGAPPVVVKDWSRRGPFVRALLAPLLVRHELAMLERVAGLPGLPQPSQRIDRLALALEFVEGRPLRRRTHGRALPQAFFTALEGILDGLMLRGVAYLDLRSPTNVLVTPSSAPALVDLGSAIALPIPRSLRRAFERRALAKLRSRFEGSERVTSPTAAGVVGARDLKLAGTRFRVRDRGRPDDPLPILLLPDAGISARVFEPIAALAEAQGRRALGVDLPGFGGSRRRVSSLRPQRLAAQLEALLDALRIARVDVAAAGWGVRPGAALAARAPQRVRRFAAIAACEGDGQLDPERLRDALRARLPGDLPEELRGALARELAGAPARNLRLAARAARELTPIGVAAVRRIELTWPQALAGARLFAELGAD
ncbi:MAG: alpha/beta fold hydrolase [Myxococcota bacterium]